MSDDLHHEDGTHRGTARTANGRDVERHEQRIRAHTADGHQHHVFPREVERGAGHKIRKEAAASGERMSGDPESEPTINDQPDPPPDVMPIQGPGGNQ